MVTIVAEYRVVGDHTTADILLKKVQENEKERKAMAGVTKAVREKAKKAAIHNKKLTAHWSGFLSEDQVSRCAKSSVCR